MARAGLVHCLVANKEIDLPTIVAENIYGIAQSNAKNNSLAHSSLISQLCRRQGVVIPDGPGLIKVLTPINKVYIDSILAGVRPRREVHEQEEGQRPAAAAPGPQEMWRTIQRMERMHLDMQRHQVIMHHRQLHTQHCQDLFQDWMVNHFGAGETFQRPPFTYADMETQFLQFPSTDAGDQAMPPAQEEESEGDDDAAGEDAEDDDTGYAGGDSAEE